MVDVRIIAGDLKGRKIQLAKNSQLRPTMGRVRETLFNWLAGEVYGKRCLDVFAGTGVLGFEALSRGASEVVFFEKHKATAQLLQKNIDTFRLGEHASIRAVDSIQALKSKPQIPFDIIFLDPPFAANMLLPSLEFLLKNDYLSSDAWIYVEVEAGFDLSLLPEGLSIYREKHLNDLSYILLQS